MNYEHRVWAWIFLIPVVKKTSRSYVCPITGAFSILFCSCEWGGLKPASWVSNSNKGFTNGRLYYSVSETDGWCHQDCVHVLNALCMKPIAKNKHLSVTPGKKKFKILNMKNE